MKSETKMSRKDRLQFEAEQRVGIFPSEAHRLACLLCVALSGGETAPQRTVEFLRDSRWTAEQMQAAYAGQIDQWNEPPGFLDIMGAMRMFAEITRGKQRAVARKFQANTLQYYLSLGRTGQEARWLLYYL